MCERDRVLVRAHGASALNKVTEFSLALPLYTVQFSWRASPRSVCVCWCVGVTAECVFMGGRVCARWGSGGRGGFVWTEWTLISRLISPKGCAEGEVVVRGVGGSTSPSCLVDGNRSGVLPPHTRTHTRTRVLQVFSDMTLRRSVLTSHPSRNPVLREGNIRTNGPPNRLGPLHPNPPPPRACETRCSPEEKVTLG